MNTFEAQIRILFLSRTAATSKMERFVIIVNCLAFVLSENVIRCKL